MPKFLVPSDQTVILSGLKPYCGKSEIESFLLSIKCDKPIFFPNPKSDSSGTSKIYLNFSSKSEAINALKLLNAITEKPFFCVPEKYSASLKSGNPPGIFSTLGSGPPSTNDETKKEPTTPDAKSSIYSHESSTSSPLVDTALKVESKPPQPQVKAESDSSTDDDSDEELFADFLVKFLEKKGGSMSAGPVGSLQSKKKAWQSQVSSAGGLKSYIEDHDDRLEFMPDRGCGTIRLCKCEFKLGEKVQIKSTVDRPSNGWGDVFSWSVGTVKKVEGKRLVVDFPEQKGWKGCAGDLELAADEDPTKSNSGNIDARFESFGFVRFDKRRIAFTGRYQSVQQKKEYGFAVTKEPLTPEKPYFTVQLINANRHGVGIGLCQKPFFCGRMVGWSEGSIGHHSDDGDLFLGDAVCTGYKFGPTSSCGDILGCGVIFSDKTPTTLYFTRNGACLGRIPFSDSKMLFPIVTSIGRSTVEIDLGCSNPSYLVKNACSVKGSGSSGTTREYHNFSQAVSKLTTGDVVTVNDGVHVLNQVVILNVGCEVVGDAKNRPTISGCHGRHVFNCASRNVSLKGLKIISQGGDSKARIERGAAGVVLTAGSLFIQNCSISSEKGTGVAVSKCNSRYSPPLLSFILSDCSVGPCGRHGIILETCSDSVEIRNFEIENCTLSGIAANTGGYSRIRTIQIENGKVKSCATGMTIIPCLINVVGTTITSCSNHGIYAQGSSESLNATFTRCSITSTKCSVKAEGSGTKVIFDQDCDWPSPRISKDGASIITIQPKPCAVLSLGSDQKAEDLPMLQISESPTKSSATDIPLQNRTSSQTSDANLNSEAVEKVHAQSPAPTPMSPDDPSKSTSQKDGTTSVNSGVDEKAIDATVKRPEGPAKPSSSERDSIIPTGTSSSQPNIVSSTPNTGSVEKAVDVLVAPKSPEGPAKSKDSFSSSQALLPQSKVETQSIINVEKDNFGRICRLVLEACPAVLKEVFKVAFSKSRSQAWTPECGPALLASIDDYTQRKLGKQAVVKIRSGSPDEWDVTILVNLLLSSPGFLKSNTKAADCVDCLREQRNNLVHVHMIKGLSMTTEIFEKEWSMACDNMKSLLDTFPQADCIDFGTRLRAIQVERFSDSQVDSFVEQLQAQIRELAEKAEDALMKAENAATRTEVDRRIVALEELIMKNGQIDHDRLPQLVELSNKTKYHVIRRVGSGGMGTVYAAVGHDDTAVALKLCEVTETDRGDREATILQRLVGLQHPNIVRYLDSARLRTRLVIVMELVKGESLDSWLENQQLVEDKWPVTLEHAKDIMLQLTSGMSAVHEMHIAHRDLKPANVMFDEVTQHIVIVDFGLSKDQNANQTVTNAVSVVGTTLYMSPEQLNGVTREIDIRTDVWSLGIIFFEVLTGVHPFAPTAASASQGSLGDSSESRRRKQTFSKADEGKLTHAILECAAPAIPGLPDAMQQVVTRALAKLKRERFSHARDMHCALEDAWRAIAAAPAAGGEKPPSKGIANWSEEDVAGLFRACKFDHVVPIVHENSINGKMLMALTDEELMESAEDGGLGLKKLQVKRLRLELESHADLV